MGLCRLSRNRSKFVFKLKVLDNNSDRFSFIVDVEQLVFVSFGYGDKKLETGVSLLPSRNAFRLSQFSDVAP